MSPPIPRCSNCEADCPDNTVLLVTAVGKDAARLCTKCVDGVLTLKVVLTRTDLNSEFKFDGYLPVASAK